MIQMTKQILSMSQSKIKTKILMFNKKRYIKNQTKKKIKKKYL